MRDLIPYIDVFIGLLVLGVLFTLMFKILPKMYRLYLSIQQNTEIEHIEMNGSFLTSGSFWAWLFSKSGQVDIYQDIQKQRIVYYNNFRLFNLFWKSSVILLTFRVLLMFFGVQTDV